jgi:hypothetical protein
MQPPEAERILKSILDKVSYLAILSGVLILASRAHYLPLRWRDKPDKYVAKQSLYYKF